MAEARQRRLRFPWCRPSGRVSSTLPGAGAASTPPPGVTSSPTSVTLHQCCCRWVQKPAKHFFKKISSDLIFLMKLCDEKKKSTILTNVVALRKRIDATSTLHSHAAREGDPREVLHHFPALAAGGGWGWGDPGGHGGTGLSWDSGTTPTWTRDAPPPTPWLSCVATGVKLQRPG